MDRAESLRGPNAYNERLPETDGAANLVADIDSVRANKLAGWAADGSLTTYDVSAGGGATPVKDEGTQVVAAPSAFVASIPGCP